MQSSRTDNIVTKINYAPWKEGGGETEVSHLGDIRVLCI